MSSDDERDEHKEKRADSSEEEESGEESAVTGRRDLGARGGAYLPRLEPAGRHAVWAVHPARARGRGQHGPRR